MFAGVMLQTFWVAAFLSVDSRGDESYSSPRAVPCRYEPSTRLVRATDGSQVVSSAIIYTEQAVTAQDVVYPPDADPTDINQGRKPLNVAIHYDLLSGLVSHYAVTI